MEAAQLQEKQPQSLAFDVFQGLLAACYVPKWVPFLGVTGHHPRSPAYHAILAMDSLCADTSLKGKRPVPGMISSRGVPRSSVGP